MEIGKIYYFKNSQLFRRWLAKSHRTQDSAWLLFYKKHVGKATMTYQDALDQALCYVDRRDTQEPGAGKARHPFQSAAGGKCMVKTQFGAYQEIITPGENARGGEGGIAQTAFGEADGRVGYPHD